MFQIIQLASSPVCENDSTEISISISYPTSNLYNILINNSSFIIDSTGFLISSNELIKIKMINSDDLVLNFIDDNSSDI